MAPLHPLLPPLPAMPKAFACLAPLLFLAAGCACAAAAAPAQEDGAAHFQATYNWQRHAAYGAAYSGANSLNAGAEKMYTFTATAFFGLRPWQDGELWFNPEMAQGVPFSGNLVGLGGFTNGEITRAAGTSPTIYRQRLFLRQTWNQGGGAEPVDAGINQLAGSADKNRVVLTVGNFSTLDVFDNNAYAKDPRTQFMNWSHWTYAAYDYAADARGFGWGFALEWYRDDWTYRIGRLSGPQEPNMLPADVALGKHYGDQAEIEHAHTLAGQPGKLRLLVWRNRAVLARFDDALAWLQAHPGAHSNPVALFSARGAERIKYGVGINAEQALGGNLGAFLRLMKADGRTETQAFTEVDASLSAGLALKGAAWGRADDGIGLALARNGISEDRRRFLAAGGTSFFIGDGALRYKPETLFEGYYSFGVARNSALTLDYQRIANPAYNADRGPVKVIAVRLHYEY